LEDFKTLDNSDLLLGTKSDTEMKEFQSFSDLEFSKGKSISSLDWKPGGKGDDDWKSSLVWFG
jgi:hypothetical protein